MKIDIKPDSYSYDELKFYLVNEFPKVRFWELPKKRLLAEKNRFTGCYIVATKKKIFTIGAFPNKKTNIIAIFLTLIGGIIVPLGLYLLIFYKSQNKLQNQVGETIAKKYSRFHLINKTEI
jgi:hypothetical protein